MRRLPLCFLTDVSGSMVGEQLEYVQNGIRDIIIELRTDSYALDAVYVSVIEFAGRAKTLIPLTELYKFHPPQFHVGGGISLGYALEYLISDLYKNIQKTTPEEKIDSKPVVFLFIDGALTDDLCAAINKWISMYRKSSNFIAITLGDNVDTSSLTMITQNVLKLKDTTSASIKTTSVAVIDECNDDIKLAPINGINLEKIETTSSRKIDDNFIIIHGKCQSTQERYLIKYGKNKPTDNEFSSRYGLVGAYEIDESRYLSLSATRDKNMSVNMSSIIGISSCPCCGNQNELVLCKCGGVFCMGEQKVSKIPWRGMQGELITVASSELNIDRIIG